MSSKRIRPICPKNPQPSTESFNELSFPLAFVKTSVLLTKASSSHSDLLLRSYTSLALSNQGSTNPRSLWGSGRCFAFYHDVLSRWIGRYSTYLQYSIFQPVFGLPVRCPRWNVADGGLIGVGQHRTITSLTLQGNSAKCTPSIMHLFFPLNNYCTSSFKQTFEFAIQCVVDNIQFAQHPRKQLNLNIYLRRKLNASRASLKKKKKGKHF